ncbi:MAG: hypothetical protein IID52_01355 [Proteobacteria bacterium]|nr:hypothetical protein [Pseudomonadota bacterium]MCH8322208.1 hypothetical protein [Pseudomonadota bacterium]
MFCAAILSPIVTLVRTLILIVRTIVETVCEWVSSLLTVIIEVVNKICGWLPWPFNKLCKLVTKLIEVVKTVWDWVCEEVIRRIFEWIEVIVEYVIYILKWICWVIDWIIRLPALLLCRAGIKPTKYIGVCVKILAEDTANPAISIPDVEAMMKKAAEIFRRCNIILVVCNLEIVVKPEYLTSTTCEPGGMFRRFFTWFSANTCRCCSTVTIYFVEDIIDASGCAYPGTDWVTVDRGGDGGVVVQEIAHLADIWGHSEDPDNVMTDQPGGSADQITDSQCCLIRTSRFVKFGRPC